MRNAFNESFVPKHVHPDAFSFTALAIEAAEEADETPGESASAKPGYHAETVSMFMDWLASDGKSALKIGQYVLALRWLIKPDGSQKDLARRMGMDAGDLSRILQAIKAWHPNS